MKSNRKSKRRRRRRREMITKASEGLRTEKKITSVLPDVESLVAERDGADELLARKLGKGKQQEEEEEDDCWEGRRTEQKRVKRGVPLRSTNPTRNRGHRGRIRPWRHCSTIRCPS
jgi:hypothetical protein